MTEMGPVVWLIFETNFDDHLVGIKPELYHRNKHAAEVDYFISTHWKVVEQYFSMVLFVFHFSPVCNFGLEPSGVKGLNCT